MYEGSCTSDGSKVAIKVVLSQKGLSFLKEEAKVLKSVNSDFVVKYRDVIHQPEGLWVSNSPTAHNEAHYGVLQQGITRQLSSQKRETDRSGDSRYCCLLPSGPERSAQEEYHAPRTHCINL